MRNRRTNEPFSEALPELLRERDLSLRALAKRVGVGNDHLSRILSGARGKKPTSELIARISLALGLAEDYFPETRTAFVAHNIGRDPVLRDKVYDQLRRLLHRDEASI